MATCVEVAGAQYPEWYGGREITPLEGESLRRFMRTDVVTVPRYISLRELVDDYVYKYHYKMFPVVEGDTVLGCVSTRNIRTVEREAWALSLIHISEPTRPY